MTRIRFNKLPTCAAHVPFQSAVRILLFLLFYLTVLSSVWAENYTGDFLTNGVGGRALALGGAYVSVADDVTATYWNPAGAGTIPDKVQVSFMHAARRSGLGGFNYVGAINRINTYLVLGASWLHAGVDDIPIFPAFDPNISPGNRRDIARYRPSFEPDSFLSDSENAFMVTAATRFAVSQDWWDNFGENSLPPEFLLGANVKRISQSLVGKSADGVGFDAGLLIRVLDTTAILGVGGLGGFSVGLNVQDISETTLTWNTDSEREEVIPTNVKFGLSYHNEILNHRVVLSYEYESRFDGQNHFGSEYQLNKSIFLRAGFKDGDPTAGVGVNIDRFRLDYALLTNDLTSTHFLSLLAGF